MTATLDCTSTSTDNPDSSEPRNLVGFRIIDLGIRRADEIISQFVKYLGYYDLRENPQPNSACVQYLWPRLHIFITIIYTSEKSRQNGIATVLVACGSRTACQRAREVLDK